MQLLQTKFHIPEFKADSSISRNRISRLINEGSSVVLISAPAGFGKTTLLSEWVESCNLRIAWVSLEPSENTPALFWSYLITAVSKNLNICGKNRLEQIKSSGISSIENILIGMINEITEDGTEFTLVLDDYHVITDSLIHSGIEFLLDHLPSTMRLVISGRETPNLSLSKFRLSGHLCEIGAAQLRFNADETKTLLNGIHHLGLNNSDIISLRDKTEGWIAGLKLAVLSIKDQANLRMFIDKFTGSDRYIIDYLVEEVLSGLPDEVRDFMLKIAIFERFCPEICELVTGNSDSIRILNYMEQNNLFLIPLDNQREWFRYHHLFREFLFKNLQELKNNEIKNLHNKAFKWLKENGYETEAFNHCIMAKNFDQAAEYLSIIAPDLFSESGGTILKNSLERLPDKIVNKKPVLCCYSVFMKVMAGDFESSNLLYQDIFKANKVVSGFISTVKGYQYFYQTGEFEKSIEEIKNAIELLSDTHAHVREMSELILFLALRYSGDLMSVLNYCSKLMNDDSINIFTAINYADTLVEKGELSRALSVLDKSLEEEKLKYGEELRAEYSYLYIIKAEILRERNQIAEALKYCQKGLHLARNIEFLEFIFLGNLVYAKILAADSNFVEADKAIALSVEAAKASSSWGEFMSVAYQVRIELFKGNISYTEKLLKQMGDFSEKEIPYYKHHEFLSFCRYCIFNKHTKRVHEITDFMISEDLPVKRLERLIECYILKAIACYLDGDLDRSLNILEKAFQISENEGHVRLYIDEGENMQALFKECLKRKILPEYLNPYIENPHAKKTKIKISERKSIIINEFKENFNEREIEILKLMKKGNSNNQIADTLCLSINTVKWYSSRIYAKLNVKRRGEAVSFAEKYELI